MFKFFRADLDHGKSVEAELDMPTIGIGKGILRPPESDLRTCNMLKIVSKVKLQGFTTIFIYLGFSSFTLHTPSRFATQVTLHLFVFNLLNRGCDPHTNLAGTGMSRMWPAY